MKTFLSTWWDRLQSSYWLVPSLLAGGAVLLSAVTLHVDTSLNPKWARDSAWVWAGGAEGARSVLATVASSTITVGGVVFSITIVTLTLASSQFGPRLLRNFLNDRGIQLVLGVFVATFLYCLLVLRAVRGTDEITMVPFLSVTCGVALAVVSVGFLIYFIHHISTSIVAENVIARVAGELHWNIARLYPEALADAEGAEAGPAPENPFELAGARPVLSRHSGFIQAIALENLVGLAKEQNLTLRLLFRPGAFVAESSVLAEVQPSDRLTEETEAKILEAVFLGPDRTPTQDIEYSIDQLVEVAVRALSPGVNDPFTANTCLEWLGAALIQLAQRKMPSRWVYDQGGQLRVVTSATDFEGVAGAALNQVRQYGASSVSVTVRMLDVLSRVAPHLVRPGDQTVLLRHARAMRDDGLTVARNADDRSEIVARYEGTRRLLSRGRSQPAASAPSA